LVPTTKPRTELHGDYFYLVMHFPALRHSHRSREQEVDFVIGKNFIITTHYDTVDPLHKFSKIFEAQSILDKESIGEHAGFLFFFMLKKLYKAVEHEVEYVRQDIARIEDHIFTGHEVKMVEAISLSARDLLNLRQTIEPHRDALHDFEESAPRFFGEPFTAYARGLSNEYYRVHNHIVRNSDALRELRETNNSLLTTKQNETMRIFTVLAFFTFPLSLIVAIFDVKTVSNPFSGAPNGFAIIISTLVLTTLVMLWYFKHKKWL
jgi:magnesium transporter